MPNQVKHPNQQRARRRGRSKQIGFEYRTWGGKRKGAGRKPKGERAGVSHKVRPPLPSGCAIHVSTRLVGGLPSLRGHKLWAAVRKGFVFGRVFVEDEAKVFRIVHFSVQGRHIHLICEAADRTSLARGVQGFKIRVAKAVNAALGGRRGRVFTDRYHERIITNPTQCRHAISYVLLNSRRHAAEEGASYPRNRVDPFSSALWFNGWTVEHPKQWANAPPTDTDGEAPVAKPRGWLLRSGWQLGGGKGRRRLSPNFIPGLPAGADPQVDRSGASPHRR